MPSPTTNAQQPQSPFAYLEALIDLLAGSLVQLSIGLVIGVLAARVMRDRHMHWSWSAALLVVIVLVRSLLGGATLVLVTIALTATLRGRRWHHEDLSAGGDLADLAARRSSPARHVRTLFAWLREEVSTPASSLRLTREKPGLVIGHDEHRREVRIPFAGPGGGTHTLVVGATGSGKTVTQTTMATAAIERGMGVIVIDPKGDDAMRDQLARVAGVSGHTFMEWAPAGSCVYNPYACGSDTEIADKVLAGEHFTEPHYLRQAQRYLGHVVRALRASGTEISLREIVAQLEPERLRAPGAPTPSTGGRSDVLLSGRAHGPSAA